MEQKTIHFELSPKQIKYKDILSKQFLDLEIYAISDINPNRNNTHFTLDSMEKALPDFKNKPILGFFNKGDFVEHNGKMAMDIELKKEYWDTENGERILGVIRESDPVEIVEQDGLHWIRLRCALWVTYCYKQVKRLLKDKNKKISVEITVHDSYEREDGVEEILDFSLNGITILGSNILEGIQGAHLTVLEDLEDERFSEQKKVLSFAYSKMNDLEKQIDDINAKKEVTETQMEDIETKDCNIPASEENFDYKIEVDKSKEAMSTKDWGSVDKQELKSKVVGASNFKEVAGDIFLDLQEGWEDGEVTKLKYPVMQLDGNKAVYNREALGVAKAYVTKNNEQEVLNKLEDIYKKLEIEDSEHSYACEVFCDIYEDEKQAEPEVVETETAPCDDTQVNCENCDGEVVVEATEGEPVLVEGKDEEVCQDTTVEEPCQDVTTEPVPEDNHEEEILSLKQSLAEKDELLSQRQCEIEKLQAEKAEMQEKFSDYEEIKSRMEIAEEKLYKRFCDDLEMKAVEMMAGEKINEEDISRIREKCQKGEYSCEDDIKKDIAYAIYIARPTRTERFSAPIENHLFNQTKQEDSNMSRDERIRARCQKMK